jgi:ribosomal-protein-alanine N-acetyltransferase
VSLRPAVPDDAARLAALHAASFESAWAAEALSALISEPGAIGLVAEAGGEPAGFLLARVTAGEAEILTLAVDPARRGAGLGAALVAEALDAARAAEARSMLLEVAVDNTAALALYRRAGFEAVGRRPRYYARRESAPVDALILRCDLTA